MEDELVELEKHRNHKKWRAWVCDFKCQKSKISLEEYCREHDLDPNVLRWWLVYAQREDEYSFYRSFAAEYLRRAKESVGLLERYVDVDRDLRMPLIRDAIISYAVPFSKNRGRAGQSLRLDTKVVPKDLSDLHKAILEFRNVMLAHCDIPLRQPVVTPFGIGFKGRGLCWEHFRDLVPRFKIVIDAVLANTKAYLAERGWNSPDLAFQDIPEPPSGVDKDPGSPPEQKT